MEVPITLALLAVLSGMFLKGFREGIGVAIPVVVVFLALNLVVVIVGFYEISANPQALIGWQGALFAGNASPLAIIGVAALVFPQLALGLSGFETGVSMMPLVRGAEDDDPDRPAARIRNTRRLLTAAALIMSFFLITTSFVTAVLIPPAEFAPGGAANGRALSYLAHLYLGDAIGTVYDIATITILWFAGASAMAGLLNIRVLDEPRRGRKLLPPEHHRHRCVFYANVFPPPAPAFAGEDGQPPVAGRNPA